MSDVTNEAVLAETQLWLREAMPPNAGTVERAIECAARVLDIPFARAWALHYGKARQVLAAEYLNMQRRRTAALEARLARLEGERRTLIAALAADADPVDRRGNRAAPLAAE
ncbi:MAG: hypothetical protein RLZZ127_2581 [Planctomycetota bacterium]|jgi:molybdenum-dependent DNA-binding transcriptional regulator ModE